MKIEYEDLVNGDVLVKMMSRTGLTLVAWDEIRLVEKNGLPYWDWVGRLYRPMYPPMYFDTMMVPQDPSIVDRNDYRLPRFTDLYHGCDDGIYGERLSYDTIGKLREVIEDAQAYMDKFTAKLPAYRAHSIAQEEKMIEIHEGQPHLQQFSRNVIKHMIAVDEMIDKLRADNYTLPPWPKTDDEPDEPIDPEA